MIRQSFPFYCHTRVIWGDWSIPESGGRILSMSWTSISESQIRAEPERIYFTPVCLREYKQHEAYPRSVALSLEE